MRDHLEVAASKGNKSAIATLRGPEFPPALEYLYRWAQELYGRSGVGMGGLMPLSYTTIADWSRLKDVAVLPHEVEGLILLDSVMLSDGKDR